MAFYLVNQTYLSVESILLDDRFDIPPFFFFSGPTP